MGHRARAIVWAQFRTVVNFFPRSNKLALAFTTLIGLFWYGGFLTLAIAAGFLMSSPEELPLIRKVLPSGLFLAFLYWQLVPLLLVSTGSALEIKKLVVYPIPKAELFGLEVLLRISTGIEVVMVLAGAGIGLLMNPRVPLWAPFTLVVFSVFNLLVSAGVRDLLVRLLARKFIREVAVFLFVIAAALPQLVLVTGTGRKLAMWMGPLSAMIWPWTATASLARGQFTMSTAAALAGWTLAAYLFGRWQFERGLRFDSSENNATSGSALTGKSRLDPFYRLPGLVFRDPIGALIEKELRFLSRSARFRLVFLMGFSFGLLIWLPMTLGRTVSSGSWMTHNYLALVSAYALLLVSDALFWNVFGFDRAAAQLYFLVPVRVETVLFAKNLAALFFVFLEVSIITVVCLLLRFPVDVFKLVEAFAVTVTIAIFLVAIGNLSSIYSPKPVDPARSFRSGSGRQTQAILMFFFPISVIPALLAYAARYAFESHFAFYAVLSISFAFGVVVYRISMQSAASAAERKKEELLSALSGGESPIAT